MKRKTKKIITAIIIAGVIVFFHSIYSNYFADIFYTMTDEQYAHEAQSIVNYSLPPCQFYTDRTE